MSAFHVVIGLYALFITNIVHGQSHILTGPYTCTPGPSGDCRIYCQSDGIASGALIDCGSATDCHFYCNASSCTDGAIVNASGSNTLHVYVQDNANQCLNGAIIQLPNNGNAIFMTQGNPIRAFKGMTINEGHHTGHVHIIINHESTNATDAMKDMTINVQNSKSLAIIIHGNANIISSTINCPDYPPPLRYEGPLEAPCVIDLGSGGIFHDDVKEDQTRIITPNGIPKGVVFPSGFHHTHGWTLLKCERVHALNNYTQEERDRLHDPDFGTSVANCWWTSDPTMDPTSSPSSYPSSTPTTHPTALPSTYTDNPSSAPSQDLFSGFSLYTTQAPVTSFPTDEPSNRPTNPLEGAIEVTAPPTSNPTSSTKFVGKSVASSNSNVSLSQDTIKTYIIINCCVCVGIGLLILIWCLKGRKQEAKPILTDATSPSSNDLGSISAHSVPSIQMQVNRRLNNENVLGDIAEEIAKSQTQQCAIMNHIRTTITAPSPPSQEGSTPVSPRNLRHIDVNQESEGIMKLPPLPFEEESPDADIPMIEMMAKYLNVQSAHNLMRVDSVSPIESEDTKLNYRLNKLHIRSSTTEMGHMVRDSMKKMRKSPSEESNISDLFEEFKEDENENIHPEMIKTLTPSVGAIPHINSEPTSMNMDEVITPRGSIADIVSDVGNYEGSGHEELEMEDNERKKRNKHPKKLSTSGIHLPEDRTKRGWM